MVPLRVRRLGPCAGWAASSAATVRLRSSALGPWAALVAAVLFLSPPSTLIGIRLADNCVYRKLSSPVRYKIPRALASGAIRWLSARRELGQAVVGSYPRVALGSRVVSNTVEFETAEGGLACIGPGA